MLKLPCCNKKSQFNVELSTFIILGSVTSLPENNCLHIEVFSNQGVCHNLKNLLSLSN